MVMGAQPVCAERARTAAKEGRVALIICKVRSLRIKLSAATNECDTAPNSPTEQWFFPSSHAVGIT